MKFIHLSDLHLGKRFKEYSLIEDQKHILNQIVGIVQNEKPDGVIIAGDIYDKSNPSAEAVTLFDDFLVNLVKCKTKIFIISGNHDSAERIAYASRILSSNGVYLSQVYNGTIEPISMQDAQGTVNVYLLPFVRSSNVRAFYPDEKIENTTDAMRVVIKALNVNTNERNVLVTHQFVTGAKTCDSEESYVGGTENVDASVFDAFDYVALGHIHSPQKCGSDKVRYCGTPLKYSFSEAKDAKAVLVVELGPKGDATFRQVELKPLHDVVDIRGTYDELTQQSYYAGKSIQEDFVRITLTDETETPDAYARLRPIYHNLMEVRYDNKRTREYAGISLDGKISEKTPMEIFAEFFEMRMKHEMNEEQKKYIENIIQEIWGGNA